MTSHSCHLLRMCVSPRLNHSSHSEAHMKCRLVYQYTISFRYSVPFD